MPPTSTHSNGQLYNSFLFEIGLPYLYCCNFLRACLSLNAERKFQFKVFRYFINMFTLFFISSSECVLLFNIFYAKKLNIKENNLFLWFLYTWDYVLLHNVVQFRCLGTTAFVSGQIIFYKLSAWNVKQMLVLNYFSYVSLQLTQYQNINNIIKSTCSRFHPLNWGLSEWLLLK